MNVSSSGPYQKANIFLGLIEHELNSLLGASHLVDHISVHIRFDLERYLLNIYSSQLVLLSCYSYFTLIAISLVFILLIKDYLALHIYTAQGTLNFLSIFVGPYLTLVDILFYFHCIPRCASS